jgi:hypothetical protein
VIKPASLLLHHQEIEIILDANKTDQVTNNLTNLYNAEIHIAPSSTMKLLQSLEIPSDTNKNGKIRSTSADIYLQSPKVKSSSSSSTLSMQFERPKDDATGKLHQSAIYSTAESVGSTSSFSSNLVNSSPSPSYQQNKSQELISNTINSDLIKPVAYQLNLPQVYKNVQLTYKPYGK